MRRLAAHRERRWLLLALIMLGWGWRLFGLDFQSLWRDEVDSLLFATRPLAQALAMFTRPGENGPLYFFLLRPWLALAGHTEYAMRFPSAVAGVLALPLIFVWGRRLFGAKIGLLATLLLAVNPYHVWYSQEAKMYSLLVVLVMLALWAFVWALEKGGLGRWLLWLALTSISFYIHVLAVLVIPLQMLWFILQPQWRRRWRAYGLALAVLILPYVPLVWWQWKLFNNPTFRTGHPFVPLANMLQILFMAQIQGIPLQGGVWVYAPIFFLLLAAAFLPGGARRAKWLLACWWLFPPLALYLITLRTPLFSERYLIWIMPALLLGLALGAWNVARQQRWLAVVAVLAVLGLQVMVGWQQSHQPIKSDFRAAAAYVQQRRQTDDLLIFLIPYIRPTYQYYDPGPYHWLDAPYANRPADAALLPERLQKATAGVNGVWLIESEAEFYDAQGLLRQWLETNATRIDAASFTRVTVTHYRLDQPPADTAEP